MRYFLFRTPPPQDAEQVVQSDQIPWQSTGHGDVLQDETCVI